MSAPDPQAELMQLINGYQISQALHVAAVLGVADQMKDAPKAYDELAQACGAHPRSLYRLMRALAAVGVFDETAGKEFSLTAVGHCLTGDSISSRRNWARFVGRPGPWHAWGNLLHSIRSGEAAYPVTHGTDSWSYRNQNPEEQASFDSAMTGNSLSQARAVIEAYDFRRFSRIVDIGGGQGLLLREIVLACSSSGGVLAAAGLDQRVEIVAGSFFEAIPTGGDAYVMKSILHDWDDDKATEILRMCRRAMASTAMLLVIERVIGPPNAVPEGKFSDLNMLVTHGALERTKEEFDELFQRAGIELIEVVPTRSPLSVILGKPGSAL